MSRSSLTPLLLASGALGAVLLAGCGGGGGNGNNSGGNNDTGGTGTNTSGTNNGTILPVLNADVIGKVTDTQGNGVPGVSLIPDSGGTAAVSLGQGSYRLNGLTGNVVHRITASVQSGGTQYTGSTEVLTQSNLLVSNANILLSPTGRQATVSGTVQNASGVPIANVRVFLALPNGSATQAGNYSSLIAFTDANGVYTIPNIPSDAPSGGAVTITASTPGASNQTFTLATLQPSGSYSQNFTLNASTQAAVGAPTIAFVTTATEPVDSQSGRAIQAHLAGGPAAIYDQIRRRLSPAYARAAARHAVSGKRLTARLAAHVTGDYAVETDIAFDNPAQAGSVVGNTIYRTAGTAASVLPTESASDAYDFLQDPLANYYTDLTFSTNTSTTVTGTQYNFALSATNTDSAESGLSATYSITPLGQLTLNAPITGQVYVGTATITWTPATGAARYYVDIYDQYPTIGLNPLLSSAALPAGTASYTVPALKGGQDYYVVVSGVADPVETLLPTATATAAVVGGAQTYSQITRFHIQ